MHKIKRNNYSAIILLLLILIIVSGCSNSVKESPIVKVLPKQEDVLLFPAHVNKDGVEKWGYINSKGTFLISPQFDNADDFQKNGLAIISINALEGLINKKGEIILKPTFDSISDFSEGLAIGNTNFKSTIINDKGDIVFSSDYNIGNFTNGFATISKGNGINGYNYGYMDKNLKVVAEPTYMSAENFSDNKALVKISENQYQVIDNELKIISTLNFSDMNGLSEDIISFMDKNTYKHGYVNIEGKVIFPATSQNAIRFKEGLAVVNLPDAIYYEKAGVIDRSGNYVIQANYSNIEYIGNKIFAATKLNKEYGAPYFAPKSLLDSNGKQLTDFKYFDITKVDDNTLLVTDDTSTYFLDNTGKEITNLPKFTGNGSASINNDFIKANIDQKLSYVTKSGKVIWQESTKTGLSNGFSLNSIKYSPNRSLLIYYPELNGLKDLSIQATINDRFKKEFLGDAKGSDKYEDGSYATSTTIYFEGSQNKDLLTILLTGYIMPNGAAHGMPSKMYYNIDLKTGVNYKLSDLFNNNSGYISKLKAILKAKMEKANKEEDKIYPVTTFTISPDQGFYLTKDALNIFFTPYEIASYAEGFPTFAISYNEIKDIINTKGEFWKAFERNSTSSTDSLINTSIENYEKGLVNAINANDFTLVEPMLIKDSNLYKSQKSLLTSLNKQNIKEKLTGYSISKIEWNENKTQCKAFVDEIIAIKYPDKDYVDKEFSYVYTLNYSENNKLLLSDIGQ